MPADYQQKWYAFIGIALLSFGCYLDYTVVNVALPTIQQELHADLTQLQWIMNIYFLALCVLATIMGRCGDLFGRRRMLYTGVGVFGIASLVAGFAPDINWLIFGRLLQGIGAAIVFPLGPSLLPESFPSHEREKSIAWLGSLGGIALALGPVLGGTIVTYWGWRWIFFINIPIIVLGYVFCYKPVKEVMEEQTHRDLDWSGMFLLAVTMGGIVLGLIHSQAAGWSDYMTLFYFVVGIGASILLVKIETNKTNPLIDFRDFNNVLFYSGAVLCFLAGVLSAVALFFDPLYLQIILKQSPELSGIVLFSIPIAVFLVAMIVGRLINRLGIVNTILLGLGIGILSGFLQIFFSNTSALWYIVIAFVCLGSMWAMGNTVPIIAAQTAVGPSRVSVATGTIITMFNVGGSVGLAIAVVIYNFLGNKSLEQQVNLHPQQLSPDLLMQLKQLIANPAHSLQMPMNDVVHQFFNVSFMQGFAGVMWFLLILSVVLFLSVAMFKKRSQMT